MQFSSKRKLTKYLNLLTRPILFSLAVVLLIVMYFKLILPVNLFLKNNNISAGFIYKVITGQPLDMKNQDGRTDILLLGIGGGVHDGSDLTDTIILLSINLAKNDMVMVSVPRDIWIPTLKVKINTVYHYGEEKKNGGGQVLVKSAISETTGRYPQYYVLADFAGFKKIIDLVDGVEIEVDKSFDDNNYPIEGKENDLCNGDPAFACRYEHLHFDQGWQHMDGDRVLKYVRSRYAESSEGTDFARSLRQQKVILALKEKLKNYLLKNPYKIVPVLNAVNATVKTDLTLSEKIILVRSIIKTQINNIRRVVLDTGDDKQGRAGLLINPPLWKYDGAWVLEPRLGNFTEIQKYISCELDGLECKIK